MKSGLNFLIPAVLLITALNSTAYSQSGWKSRGSGGWGHKGNYNNLYNDQTVETINGTVVEINSFLPMKGMSSGIHLMLQTDKELISVHLGPEWYIENQDLDLSKNDKIEVKGSRITYNGKPAFIAAELKKGNEILKLRDDNGFPAWNGWRKK